LHGRVAALRAEDGVVVEEGGGAEVGKAGGGVRGGRLDLLLGAGGFEEAGELAAFLAGGLEGGGGRGSRGLYW